MSSVSLAEGSRVWRGLKGELWRGGRPPTVKVEAKEKKRREGGEAMGLRLALLWSREEKVAR